MRALLSQNEISLVERDFFKERFTEDELKELSKIVEPGKIFSWRSPSFKKLGVSKDNLADGDLLGFMFQEPRLIRRPIVYYRCRIVIGADLKAIQQMLI